MKLNKINKIVIAIIGLSICIFLLYLLTNNSNKEGFVTLKSVTYSDTTITDYNNYIAKIQADDQAEGKPAVFRANIDNLQKMGVPESDVQNYIKTGSWEWSAGFIDAIKQTELNAPNKDETTITNDIIEAQKSMPELSYIGFYGAMYGLGFSNSAKKHNLGCKIDPTTKKATGDSMYTLDASGNVTSNAVENSQLPTLIPGFTFMNSPCNPCNILNYDYSCPFAVPDDQNQPLFPGFIMEYAWNKDANTSTSSQVNDITDSISHLF